MREPNRDRIAFVRALLGGVEAKVSAGSYAIASGPRLDLDEVRDLIQSGAIAGDATSCRANASSRNWLKRQMLEIDPFNGQHRNTVRRCDLSINLSESPIARLAVATAKGGEPFLESHHVEAAERIRRLVERAALQPRMTMNYTAAHSVGGSSAAPEIGDMAADARRELARISAALPHDCFAIALDVCGFLKGLQQVEIERGWPRRSAKLVLRIALECLAEYYGLSHQAIGAQSRRPHRWMDETARPARFA
jgi:hypothetical protein